MISGYPYSRKYPCGTAAFLAGKREVSRNIYAWFVANAHVFPQNYLQIVFNDGMVLHDGCQTSIAPNCTIFIIIYTIIFQRWNIDCQSINQVPTWCSRAPIIREDLGIAPTACAQVPEC